LPFNPTDGTREKGTVVKQIRRISPGSAALFGAALAGVYVFVVALMIWILEVAGAIGDGGFLGAFLGLTVGTFFGALVAGILAAVSGAIAGFFYAIVYNVVAAITGGLVIEMHDN
jgi:hypothetical protein